MALGGDSYDFQRRVVCLYVYAILLLPRRIVAESTTAVVDESGKRW